MINEFDLRNDIINLFYKLLEKNPDNFVKIDDDNVVYMIDLSSKLTSFNKDGVFRGIQLKIIKSEENSIISYNLYVFSSGDDLYFKYFISELDPKTAYKFFQTQKQEEKQNLDLQLVRDTLLKEIEK